MPKRYALTSEDIVFAKEHRRSHNRLGFAIEIALVRDLSRLLRAGEAPPQAVVSVVADQLDIDPAVFGSTPSATKRAGNRRVRLSLR